jgi:hypothetical protein
MMTTTDRRRFPRAKFTGITFISAGPFKVPCIAGDLSESGILIFIPTTNVLEPGLQLGITFTLLMMSSWIELDGTVVRQARHNSRTSVGIRFNKVPADVQSLLRSYVCTHQSSSSSTAPGKRPYPRSSTGKD